MLLAGELVEAVNIAACERLQRISEAVAFAGSEEARKHTGGLWTYITVPLRAGEEVLGVLNVARVGEEPADTETILLLKLVADSLGVAIARRDSMRGWKRHDGRSRR